jgi:hypothetical protein
LAQGFIKKMETRNPVPDFIIHKHVRENIERDLPMLSYGKQKKETLYICGGGPTLRNYLNDIHGDVFGVNGSGNYLDSHGIKPKYIAMIDPLPQIVHAFEPLEEVEYIIATQCHPDVFDKLKGCKVTMFNAAVNAGVRKIITEFPISKQFILGGGASISTRSLGIGWVLGYRNFKFYGVDCSVDGGDHAYEQDVKRGEKERDYLFIKGFKTVAGFYADALSMLTVLDCFERGTMVGPLNIEFYGDNLLNEMISEQSYKKLTVKVIRGEENARTR